MPSKQGSHHSKKAHRQAEHIQDSEMARGMPAEQAERVGWATVRKQEHEGEQPSDDQ